MAPRPLPRVAAGPGFRRFALVALSAGAVSAEPAPAIPSPGSFLAPVPSPSPCAPTVTTQAHKGGGLVFAHIPCNFGHSVEWDSLGGSGAANRTLIKAAWETAPSSYLGPNTDGKVVKTDWRAWAASPNISEATGLMVRAKGSGGLAGKELWGMTYPPSWVISNVTGCNLYYTPGKLWPSELARQYFGERFIFGILRDPYDKMANEFRRQVQGIDSAFNWQIRPQIDAREGNKDRESERYARYYATCDVNGYLMSELNKYKAGDRFRGNCALLPQADYFDPPFGIALPVDNRKFPDNFNELMAEYNYPTMNMTIHNWDCVNVSAYSLNAEVKELIKEIYARDFELLCSYFGYCDRDEMTCLEQIPNMCGGKPEAKPDPK